MVKKQLASGDPCEKCAQAEEMLRRRGLWERIDEVVWAVEGDDTSPGARLAAEHGVELAPFFVVRDDEASERVFTSALRLVRDCFPSEPRAPRSTAEEPLDLRALAERFASAEPQEILRFALERFGERCAIAFRGGEDIVLIDMATRLGLPFRAFSVDTGRLDEETYAHLDEVRRRYGIAPETWFPEADAVTDLVRRKGPNSFYRDGHEECCAIRRFGPLRRALLQCEAWVTAKRRSPGVGGRSRSAGREVPIAAIQVDQSFRGAGGALVRVNPLARWSRARVWQYMRKHDVPHNELYDRGYPVIGCQPCTRPTGGAHGIRQARWWWEKPETADELHESGDGI